MIHRDRIADHDSQSKTDKENASGSGHPLSGHDVHGHRSLDIAFWQISSSLSDEFFL